MNIDQLALETARKIEALHDQPMKGGSVQRQAKIQVIVTEAIIKHAEPCRHDDPPRVAADGSCLRCGAKQDQDCKDVN